MAKSRSDRVNEYTLDPDEPYAQRLLSGHFRGRWEVDRRTGATKEPAAQYIRAALESYRAEYYARIVAEGSNE